MATRLDIVLDRFARIEQGVAVDLATGELVELRTGVLRSPAEERSRAETAAFVSSLRIAGVAELVDYGVSGRGGWIEAYRRDSPVAGAGSAAETPLSHAAIGALIGQAGGALTTGRDAAASHDPGGALFLPLPLERVVVAQPPPTADPPSAWAYDGPPVAATRIERRDEIDAVTEWLAGTSAPGARHLRIDAPPGAGRRIFFEMIARECRLAGFVPVWSGWCGQADPPGLPVDRDALCATLRDRHIVILDPPGAAAAPAVARGDVARFLSRLNASAGRPHALIDVGSGPCGAAGISLGPMRAAQLRRALLCAGVGGSDVERAMSVAVARSGGWPRAFAAIARAALGIRAPDRRYRFSRSAPSVVREGAAAASRTAAAAQCDARASALVARAAELAGKGRHAAAERLLRRAAGRLHRRQAAGEEARTHLALGRLLLDRGRRTDACEAFERSRRLFDDGCETSGVVIALLHLGFAHIEDGTLSAAESVLRTAAVAAAHAGLAALERGAGLLLARCLYWQGRHEEAWSLVNQDIGRGRPMEEAGIVAESPDRALDGAGWGAPAATCARLPGLETVAAEIGVRMALRGHDAGLAARRLAAAGEAGPHEGAPHAGALIALRLLLHGALGDLAAITSTAGSGVALMRRLHAPLAAREIRLAQLEALIDARARTPAAACLRRLSARPGATAGGLAGTRLQALAERLEALARDAPGLPEGEDGTVETGAVVRMLQQCHEAASEHDAVVGVCQMLRRELRASGVTAFSLENGSAHVVSFSGGRACRPELAERTAASLMPVGPEASASGKEAAVPVRYGGAVVGAVVARWAPGFTEPTSGRARGIMAAAAATIGPAMAALIAAPATREDAALGDLGGPSFAMADVRRQVARAAAAPYPVLILGESGTGKELIAKAIHAGSARRSRRFCAVNCAAVSDELFEAELFGHSRGAFTGAASDRPGLFEDADGGTLFLDEVGELSPRAQAKLLRALQEGEIRRVGENHSRRVDTRVVAATNRPLCDDTRTGRFRQDLLYRLDVVRITVPPLRERPEDIAPLAREFWRDAMRRTGGQAQLSPATLAALARYEWPGNVRELQNALAALAVQAPLRGWVGPGRLPAVIGGDRLATDADALPLAEARRRFEARYVRLVLARSGGQRAAAASSLGVSRQGLAKLITRLRIGDAPGLQAGCQGSLQLSLEGEQHRVARVAGQAPRDG